MSAIQNFQNHEVIEFDQQISKFFDETGNLKGSVKPSTELIKLLCEKFYQTGNWIIPHRFRNLSTVLGEGAYGKVQGRKSLLSVPPGNREIGKSLEILTVFFETFSVF